MRIRAATPMSADSLADASGQLQRRLRLALWLGTTLLAIGCGATQRAGPPMTPMQRAQRALDEGRLRDANEAIRADAEAGDRDAVLLSAEIAMRGGQYADAVVRLERAQLVEGDGLFGAEERE